MTTEKKYNTLFNNRWFSLFREKAGVISEEPCWVLFYDVYAHYNTSLFRLLVQVVREYKNDSHLAM